MTKAEKFLSTFSLLQTVAVVVLITKFTLLDVKMTSNAVAPVTIPKPVDEAAASKPSVFGDQVQPRQIIREEVATALSSLATPQPTPKPEIAPGAQSQALKDSENSRYERELVQSQLDAYVSQGAISDVEMASLQTQIAKLDHTGRKLMLGELSRALNSGVLKGNL